MLGQHVVVSQDEGMDVTRLVLHVSQKLQTGLAAAMKETATDGVKKWCWGDTHEDHQQTRSLQDGSREAHIPSAPPVFQSPSST